MYVGFLVTSIGEFGKKGFYNTQEIGLAKAIEAIGNEVVIYKLVTKNEKRRIETIEGCNQSTIILLPSRKVGRNGIINTKVLDKSLDALIYFSDTQFSVPKVYYWAKKNNVDLFPYIGVTESHSTTRAIKCIVNMLFMRNLKVYKKTHCLAKTPMVKTRLHDLGVDNVSLLPVGLDSSLLNPKYRSYEVSKLKEKYGYKQEDKVLLFIGRFIEEKQPLRMIEIFSNIIKGNDTYKLLMVGTGELKDAVVQGIKNKKIKNKVQIIESIPNVDIWELYCLAETFINLNQQEIFGMAILEAMYYGCRVIAWHAPGPNFIIENNVSGYLVSSNEEVIEKIKYTENISIYAHKRVVEKFTWDAVAGIVNKILISKEEIK